jgi:hypothetical protein
MLAKAAKHIVMSLGRQHTGEPFMTVIHKGIADLHEVQWLLGCYAALIAQELHRQLQGRQPAWLPKNGTYSLQQQQQQQVGQQQEGAKVAPVHKRLLDGLLVPGLIGWEHVGLTNTLTWKEPEAYSVVMACAMFNVQLAHLEEHDVSSSSSSGGGGNGSIASIKPQQSSFEPPLLTATVHLRRAAVLLELSLLFPEVSLLMLALQCMKKETECMCICLLRESGSEVAAWDRVYTAVASGILPTMLQQLLPTVARMLQAAAGGPEDEIARDRAVAEVGIFLAAMAPSELLRVLRWLMRMFNLPQCSLLC